MNKLRFMIELRFHYKTTTQIIKQKEVILDIKNHDHINI